MTEVDVATPQGDMRCYLAEPPSTPAAAVVVLHDALGMTNDHRAQADWLAGEGYLALAVDLFHRGGPGLACMRAVMRDVRAGRGPSFDDVEAARRWLVERPGCTGKVGVIGFCLTGGFALMLAPGRGFSVASVNYGFVPAAGYDATYLAGACPVVASFGRRDLTLRGAAARLERALDAAGVPHDVKEYAEAGHMFLNDHQGHHDRLPLAIRAGGLITRSGYRADDAADARARILAFFERSLRTS